MSNKLIYLAAPYSHKDPGVMQLRRAIIAHMAAKFMEQGHHVYSPITESACYAENSATLGGNWSTWSKHDRIMLIKCDEMWVLKLKGYDKSVGVQNEIAICNEPDVNLPIRYIEVEEYLKEVLS